jgi:TonB family protein
MSPRIPRLPFRRAARSGCLAGLLALAGSLAAVEATPAAPGARATPAVVRRVTPQHPPELKQKLVNGNALLEGTVDASGKMVDIVIVRESHPGFGAAAEEALRQWEFAPGPADAQPVRVRIPFEFRLSAEEVLETIAGRPVYFEVQETVIPAAQLPAWPNPLQYYVPRYPPELEGSGKYGKAVVNITIDKEGKVINPRLVKATYPEFALPALITAMRLQFPPQVMANNEKIYVNMDLQFDFKAPKDGKSANAGARK